MSWMMGRSKRNYLFADGDLGDSLRQHVMKAVQEIDEIPETQFKAASDAEISAGILAKFNVVPLELHEDAKTMNRSESKIDVSRNSDRNPFGDRGPIYVNSIRVVISIPFSGEQDLWKLKPSTWQSTFPQGEVRGERGISGGLLDIVIEQPADENPEAIKQYLDNQLRDIRFYIQNQKQQIMSELSQMPERLRSAITARRQRLAQHNNLADILGIPEQPPATAQRPPLRPVTVTPTKSTKTPARSARTPEKWDVFVSHASEDKDEFARPLAEALRAAGLKVWFDEHSLTVGDSLRQSIDRGLANSRFGVVIISPHFLEKHWPQKELDGLAAREVDGQKVILPVWHNVDRQTVTRYSPTLADRLATVSTKGVSQGCRRPASSNQCPLR